MAKKEKVFRIVSLFLVGLGFIVVVSGANRERSELNTLEHFVEDLKAKEEAEKNNNPVSVGQLNSSEFKVRK